MPHLQEEGMVRLYIALNYKRYYLSSIVFLVFVHAEKVIPRLWG